jgi:hypothetical protein
VAVYLKELAIFVLMKLLVSSIVVIMLFPFIVK